ncbi:copper chaperone PCu(A)C [Sphingomonas humi]|uniref:Copper chaperone PCu(A)C n=1 Tax=Sphingomonas humi TaxID=335630 RepID=A0ABP7S550_9SPHN
MRPHPIAGKHGHEDGWTGAGATPKCPPMRTATLFIAALLATPAMASPGDLHVQGYANAGISGSAAYVTVHNGGSKADRLLGASSPAASSVTIHQASNAGGVMRMRAAGPQTLAPGAMIAMKPGGLHLMVMGLKSPLRPGARLPLVLRFEKAGLVRASLPVLPPGAQGPAAAEAHHGH